MENRNDITRSERGSTVLFVMSAFLVVSFIGVVLMKMSQHDSAASSDLSASSTAQHAARSGVLAASAFFSSNTAATLEILNEYIEDVTAGNNNELTPWLFGGPSTTVAVDQMHKFKVQLLAFTYDPLTTDKFSITVRSTGYGKGKSETTVVSVIALSGLEWNMVVTPGVITPSTGGNENALYFKGPHEFNSRITLDGSAYFDSDVYFSDDAGGVIFNKPFIARGVATFRYSAYGAHTFNDVAYFIAKPQMDQTWNGTMNFNRKSGFENGRGTSAGFPTFNWGDTRYDNTSPGNPTANIPDLLGLADKISPTPPTLNESVLPASFIYTWPGNAPITANSLHNVITNAGTNLWNGYAVVKIPYGAQVEQLEKGGLFTGKIIIINEGEIRYGTTPCGWPNCSDNSVTVLINKNNLYWGQNPYSQTQFRGYIFNTNTQPDPLIPKVFFLSKDAGGCFDKIVGAVHDSKDWGSQEAHWHPNHSYGRNILEYNSTIINDIAATGLINGIGPRTAGVVTPGTTTVTLTAVAGQSIVPTILSMQY